MYGDLIHILRSPQTGQPILQKRMIEYPEDVVAWGYCPIPVDLTGAEIPFADLSCDVHPDFLALIVEVDYFGRLSGGRTKEVNQRMHFDEIIETIQDSEIVTTDGAGRLQFGTECTGLICTTWKVLDSPMANLAFYRRVMKYGHMQTDPMEVDTNFHGDPATGTVYHPALRAEDWPKFQGAAVVLLPSSNVSECFNETTFIASCALPQALSAEDFVRAASFLAGAADKTGRITIDLVQYMNRILRIPVATAMSAAPITTLPALIRDEDGFIAPATDGLPAPANERFVDFTVASYFRDDRFNVTVPALQLTAPGVFTANPAVPLLDFLLLINGTALSLTESPAFVANGNDALRAVEFIHNYEIPLDLYVPALPTTTTVAPVTVEFSAVSRNVALSATITNGTPVNGGAVLFRVTQSDGTLVGVPVLSGTVVNGAASVTYTLPGGTPVQVLNVTAAYTGAKGFAPSTGVGTLTIQLGEPPALSVANVSAAEGTASAGVLNFVLTLSNAYGATITVQYATESYTAIAPADYTAVMGTATFDPGVTTVTIPVTLVADAVPEPNETMALTLSGAANAVIVRGVATGQILNDDGDVDNLANPALDFNQDGLTDLVWRHSTNGRIGIWFMNGLNALYGIVTDPPDAPLAMELRAVGDFNADWKPDMVFQNATDGTLTAWIFDGSTRTSEQPLTVVGGGSAEPALEWKIMAAADMDKDGALDLLWQNLTTGELRIWHMAGTVQIDSRPVSLGVGTSAWRIVGAADMNRDGWTDIVWRNPVDGLLAVWLMADTEVMATLLMTPASVADPLWQIGGVGDMNSDGFADLVWQHNGGKLAVWLMNGLKMTSTPLIVSDALTELDWKIVGAR